MNKELKSKAVNIKGKEYVLVKDRVLAFNAEYPNGSIATKLLSEPGATTIVFIAQVTPDTDKPDRSFTGHAAEKVGDGYINETAALENAETSAIGRALAAMGIGVIDSIASVDEVNKAENARKQKTNAPTVKQLNYLDRIADKQYPNPNTGQIGATLDEMANHLINKSVKTADDARLLFDRLKAEGIIDEL